MNRIHHIRRAVRILAGLAGALVALGAAAPAAFAQVSPPTGPLSRFGLVTPVPAPSHAAVALGMPGWQITVIAVGAAIAAAVVAVLADRAWSARHVPAATAA